MGAILTSFGQVFSGESQAEAAKYNAQVAANNAAYTSAAGEQSATNESMKNAAGTARIKASQAANGIDVNNGSAVKVQQGAREAGNIDTQTVENNALLTAYGYQAQSALDKETEKTAPIGADLQAAGSLIGNAQSVGTDYSKFASMFAQG